MANQVRVSGETTTTLPAVENRKLTIGTAILKLYLT
jgi:hypothetical protein